MASIPALPTNATQAQAIAYLGKYFPGKYSNSAVTPYQGKTSTQIYTIIASNNPRANPYSIAVATADLMLSSAVGSTFGTAEATAGQVTAETAKGVETANYLPPNTITSVAGFLSALGDINLWIRVAKVIAGGAILIVGLVKITGADKTIGGVAGKAVKFAPLL